MNDKPILLTVSGTIPADIEHGIAEGKRPLADYICLRDSLNADLLDYPRARQVTGFFGRLVEKVGGPAAMLAWACFLLHSQYHLIFTDGEQVGIPLAVLLKFMVLRRRPKHAMIGHILSVRKKIIFFDWLKVASAIDLFFVYSTFQKGFIEERLKVPPERVVFTPFMVDDTFFSPAQARPGDPLGLAEGRPMICSVGLEFRDYDTLLEAVEGLDVRVVIAAGSPWSRRKASTEGRALPSNITVMKFSQYDLRDLYATSRLVIIPLQPVEFQAGVTAILEALAMEKAVICTRTTGQTDVIVDGLNGRYVPPRDALALRAAILDLLASPETAARLGKEGRWLIQSEMNLDHYSHRLKAHLWKLL